MAYNNYPVGWAYAGSTPFKWTKQIASHFGGTRQGLAISWPNRIKDAGGIRTQFSHIIDIVPTILEATGVKAPQLVDGIKQKPIEGVSMAYTFDKANANAPTKHTTQYFEMISNRGIYHDGWYANTTPPHGPWILNAPLPAPKDYKWELYHLTEDYSQANDLAAKMPDKLKQMQALFDQEAKKYNVYPLNNDTFARALAPRPSATAGKTVFTYTGVNAGINSSNAPNILGRSYTMTAEVDVPAGGGNGMLATMGGRWGGWGLYLLNGKPVFDYNMLILAQYRWEGPDALTPGKHTIVFDYTYDGPGIAKGGSGVLRVDGNIVATGKQANSIAFLQVADETFDVGLDTRTSVNEKDYQVPFTFNGKIDTLTVKLGPMQLTEADQKQVREAFIRGRD
jgi:arylsulfatase